MNFGNISGLVNGTETVVFDHEINNLITVNGDVEAWTAGASSAPDGWTVVRADIAREGTTKKIGTYAAKLTATSDNAAIYQDINAVPLRGKTITYGAWAYGTSANETSISFSDFTNSEGAYHSGTPGWEWLTATLTVNASATTIRVHGYSQHTGIVSYFDGFRMIIGSSMPVGSTATDFACSSISTGNILNGDEDGWYTIIVKMQNTSTNSNILMSPNNDTTPGNYGTRNIRATDTDVADEPFSTLGGILTATAGTTGNQSLSISKVYAKSGSARLFNSATSRYISGTTVTNLVIGGQVWTNTADNITNITFSGTMGVGTRIIILKSNNFTNGTPTGVINTPYIQGSWVRLPGSGVLAAQSNNVAFTVDGDRDVAYYFSINAQVSTGLSCYMMFNSDSGANYGRQRLYATNTTIDAGRETTAGIGLGYAQVDGQSFMSSGILYAKSGFIRPSLINNADWISGTTINALRLFGYSWSNTADNITAINFVTSSGYLKAGSQIDLYALRPNG